MQLIVSLLEGHSYSSKSHSLPFQYLVTFTEDTMLSGPINVTGCILENKHDRDISIGYAKNIFSLPGAERAIKAGTEFRLSVDAMEHEGEPSGLIPGDYELSAKVSMQIVGSDGALHHRQLFATRQLVLL